MGETPRRGDLWIGLGLGMVVLASLIVTEPAIGIVRDEGYYFRAADHYLGWFRLLAESWLVGEFGRPFSDENIRRFWFYNAEHPVFVKVAQAFTWWLFRDVLGITSHTLGYRLGSMVFSVFLSLGTYLLGVRLHSRRAGVLGVLLLFSMPHVFFHAHLACFDVPITAMTVLVAYAYWRSRTEPKWNKYCGALFGLSLCTKLNSFFLMPVLGVFWVLEKWSHFRAQRNEEGFVVHLPTIPRVFWWMLILGPVFFFAHWPWLWYDTVERLTFYLNFHWNHVHYSVEYFGRILHRPPHPVAFPFVMSAVTVPLVTFCLGTLGFVWAVGLQQPIRHAEALARWFRARVLRKNTTASNEGVECEPKSLYLLVHTTVPFAVIALPYVPIFGGVKHWMPAMPFFAILAAIGVDRLVDIIEELRGKSLRGRSWWFALAGSLVLVPALLGNASYLANGTAFYNELAGGPEGAARMGMMRQFWGYAAKQGLPWLNENATKNAKIYFHSTNPESYDVYKRDGLIRDDLRNGHDHKTADYYVFHNQGPKLSDEYQTRVEYDSGRPVYGIYLEEAPLLVIYKRHQRPQKRPPRRKRRGLKVRGSKRGIEKFRINTFGNTKAARKAGN